MMEVEAAEDGAADLLMECDEEEQEVWPQSPKRDEEADEGLDAALSPAQEEETDPPSVRVIPIPVQAGSSCSPPIVTDTVKSSAAPLGFMVNGRLVPLLPGGGGAELKLRSHPGGSASGFTRVQIPVTLTVHSPAGTHHINTTASLTTSVPSNTPPSPSPAAPPEPGPGSEAVHTPIITGVVSGEAAQKVLSDHNVNFKSTAPLTGLASPSQASSMQTKPAASQKNKSRSNSSSRSAAPHKLLRKGGVGPVPPPDCLVCMSHYKLIPELRGFVCLCSPEISQSLKNLKRKNRYSRRSRDKSKTPKTQPQASSKVPKTRPGPSAAKVVCPPLKTRRLSDDCLSDQLSSPTTPTNIRSHQQDQSEPLPDLSHGKLVILVEDFYYGLAPGRNLTKPNALGQKFTGPYRCIHCPKTLRNNIKLMSHMQQHVSMMSQQDADVDTLPLCPHCFRRFLSPFKLQSHLEAVHSQCASTATCKICELDFGSEPSFLWHMKTTHKPGEMPYVCQVCDFRSSFYSDVWSHFQEAHADTKYLLCQYCLRVLRSNTCYQQHFARHQKKHVFGCDKCRLHFLYVKERVEHNALHHRTHIRPPQLTGLKPGTKVHLTSGVGLTPCLVVKFSSQIKCLSWVRDFRAHFPSLVHCSLCRFITCCSTSYANHMIKSCQKLECVLCQFSTSSGDVMANHLIERPAHDCVMLTQPGNQVMVCGLCSDCAIASPLSVSQLSVVLSSLCHGVSQASRWHRTSPRLIQMWTEQQERGLSDRTWYWRTEKMAEWVLRQREQQLMVGEDVLLQTTRAALEQGSSQLDCYSWTVDFMLRRGLSLQPTTPPKNHNHKNKLPKTIRETSRTFIKSLCSQVSLLRHSVGCMDEFSIFIDSDGFNNQNREAFRFFSSSEDKPAFDVILSALSDGTFLTPLLFFSGGPSLVPDGFPENILLEARRAGFTDQERLQIWINKVWRPRVATSASLLMADIHRGHQSDEFKDSLSSVSSGVIFIPSGCSCRLQPLDVCVTPVLRDFLQARWTQLVSQGGLDGLGLDQLALTLACWLSEVSSTLNSEPNVLRRSEPLFDCIQPLETPEPKPEPDGLQLLLVMKEDRREEEVEQEEKEDVRSPTALRRVFEGDSDQETFHGFQDEDVND
uniref:Pogo transposable element derived with ZNF domain a n=1 Tax=Anabas testudineus TaxID=64144 RepID=A0A7N6A845_ANATE